MRTADQLLRGRSSDWSRRGHYCVSLSQGTGGRCRASAWEILDANGRPANQALLEQTQRELRAALTAQSQSSRAVKTPP